MAYGRFDVRQHSLLYPGKWYVTLDGKAYQQYRGYWKLPLRRAQRLAKQLADAFQGITGKPVAQKDTRGFVTRGIEKAKDTITEAILKKARAMVPEDWAKVVDEMEEKSVKVTTIMPGPVMGQCVHITLTDGRKGAFFGPKLFDLGEEDKVRIVNIEFTPPAPLPPGVKFETFHLDFEVKGIKTSRTSGATSNVANKPKRRLK